jgi:hypothetical protein
MTNTDLLVTVIKQSGVATMEAEAIARAAEKNGSVLAHECVPTLDSIVGRLQQALSAAVALQERAHGTPPPKNG